MAKLILLLLVLNQAKMVKDLSEEWQQPPELVRLVVSTLDKEAARHHIDPWIIVGIIHTESRGNPNAVSHKGAIGLMQILPETGEQIARELGELNWNKDKLFDIRTNIRYGVYYLHYLMKQFEDTEAAVAAYFWGGEKIKEKIRDNEPIPTKYIRTVMRHTRDLKHAAAK